jgi:hypothetical protein
MTDEKLAQAIFAEFKAKPESMFIASEFALTHLARFLTATPIASVLEIGAGIGTITKLLLVHTQRPAAITSTEEIPVCLAELAKNLAGVDKRGWTLVNGIGELDKAAAFDLVLFDGTLDPKLQYSFFRAGTWCFVEGNRRDTRDDLMAHLAKSNLKIDFKSHFPGGCKLRVTWPRKFLGFSIPKFQIKQRKGCHIGQVTAA